MQVLPLRDMGLIAPTLAADGSVFVAAVGDAGIRRLLPTPFSQQAKALSDAQEFTEALSIAALMPSEQVRPQSPPGPHGHADNLLLWLALKAPIMQSANTYF